MSSEFDVLAQNIATQPQPDTVNVAPVLNRGGATELPELEDCPLGPADAGSPLHQQLVEYSRGDTKLTRSIQCADAALLLVSSDSSASQQFAGMVEEGPLTGVEPELIQAAQQLVAGSPGTVEGARRTAQQWLDRHQECPLAR